MASQVTSPPKGTRDFLPADVRRREFVVGRIRQVYQRYGFEPLETPSMERLETLLGKYGDEGDQLIFRLLHRGDKLKELVAAGKLAENDLADMALRYDLTVPLARVVAEHQARLPRFFKRFQVQPVWRADRPARGRFREFYQCDVDIVGSESLVCDVEVVSAICDVLDALGFADYRVRLNHRQLLRALVERAGIPVAQEAEAITALDKLDKVGLDGVRAELVQRGLAAQADSFLECVPLMKGMAPDTPGTQVLGALKTWVGHLETGQKALAQLEELLALAEHTGAGRRLLVDPSLARGLGYYTGPIFEVQVPDLAGSMGGGGRYDELVGMFLGRRVPAVGFSLGLERILVVMEERGMFPELSSAADVMVLRMEESTTPETLRLAHALRAADIRTELYPSVDKLGKQFQYAEQRGVKVAVLVGGRERDAGQFAAKVMATGNQVLLPMADAASHVRGLLIP